MSRPRYPQVVVQLNGKSWNRAWIINRVVRALDAAEVPYRQIALFLRQARQAGDLETLVRTVVAWVRVR